MVKLYQEGDIISQPKDGLGRSFIQHKILCVDDGYIHNHPDSGVAYVSPNEIDFKNATVEKFHGSHQQRKQISRNAKNSIGESYNARAHNCEHFVNKMRTGKAVSPQVNFANATANTAIVGGLIGFSAARTSFAKYGWLVVSLFGVLTHILLSTTKSD